jgi:hypothetical protein
MQTSISLQEVQNRLSGRHPGGAGQSGDYYITTLSVWFEPKQEMTSPSWYPAHKFLITQSNSEVDFVFLMFSMGPRDPNCFWLLGKDQVILEQTETLTLIQIHLSIPRLCLILSDQDWLMPWTDCGVISWGKCLSQWLHPLPSGWGHSGCFHESQSSTAFNSDYGPKSKAEAS